MQVRFRFAHRLSIVAFVCLAGCATAPSIAPAPDPQRAWETRERALADVNVWSAFGRIAIRSETDRWSATLRWEQNGDSYQIDLSGPFGQGAARIIGRPGAVELIAGDGRRSHANSPEALLRRELGWHVPLAGLRHWVLGRPSPALGPITYDLDQYGRMASFSQAGWEMRYESYGDGELALPTRLVVSRPGIAATLIVKRWATDAKTVSHKRERPNA